MKTFEEWKWKKPKPEEQYELSEAATLPEILNNIMQASPVNVAYIFLDKLLSDYKGKKVKITDVSNKKSFDIVVNDIKIVIHRDDDNSYGLSTILVHKNGEFYPSRDTEIRIYFKRTITKEDPYGEENWD